MHGTAAADADVKHSLPWRGPGVAPRVVRWLRAHRNWALIVLLPTLLVAGYYYLIAADQYETESHFVVRAAEGMRKAPSGLDQAMALVGGGGGGAASGQEALLVADYLTSHDAVAALERQLPLRAMFRRPEADVFSRLRSDDPPPETLLKFYNKQVGIKVSNETGIATLTVRAFRPADALAIAQRLLALSEGRVNQLNRRNFESAVAMSRRQLDEAEANVRQLQLQITGFRRGSRDFNPASTGQARTSMVSMLQAKLAEAEAQRAALGASLSPNSPQVQAMRARVNALSAQVASEQAQIASGPGNVATGLGIFEGLQLRRDLAGKRYEVASAALQRARDTASAQQLFVVRVVDPNLPVKSLYPKRLKIVATAFFALLLAYGIGWLIVAGVKEHAN